MGNLFSEPMENIKFNHQPRGCIGLWVEPSEQDPEIVSSPQQTRVKAGDTHTFTVNYRAFKGPVTVSLSVKDRNGADVGGSPISKSDCNRSGDISLKLSDASTAHSGTYTLKVLDEGRSRRYAANPASVSWKVTVY